MVKVLIAPDKFKGSLTASEVCEAVSISLTRKDVMMKSIPLADGGEGTFELLLRYLNGQVVETEVHDPLMRKIKAHYGLSNDGTTAFVEMAAASGLQLLKRDERNPLITSTYGTGELIAHALASGAEKIILGIGGSATNDAGVGMASALGFKFFRNDQIIEPLGGSALPSITKIETGTSFKKLESGTVIVLCDVTNPLTGETGAAHTFAPQKGASPADVITLENNMRRFQQLLLEQHQFDSNFPGAGAAGGLGAGARFFLKGSLTSGMAYLSSLVRLDDEIKQADIVITGEGSLDKQSLSGKVVGYVADKCKRQNKKLIVVCGSCELTTRELEETGIAECHVLSTGVSKEYAMTNASTLIQHRLQGSMLLSHL